MRQQPCACINVYANIPTNVCTELVRPRIQALLTVPVEDGLQTPADVLSEGGRGEREQAKGKLGWGWMGFGWMGWVSTGKSF